MYQHGVATIAGSSAPTLVVMHRYQFTPMVWKKNRPVHRSRTFRNIVLLLLFTTCLSGITLAAAAEYALLTLLK